jgi:hypothetical protein
MSQEQCIEFDILVAEVDALKDKLIAIRSKNSSLSKNSIFDMIITNTALLLMTHHSENLKRYRHQIKPTPEYMKNILEKIKDQYDHDYHLIVNIESVLKASFIKHGIAITSMGSAIT